MICIRGAIQAENTKQSIWQETETMLREAIQANDLALEEIVAIQFTATADLDAAYPAVAARKMGITEAALSCVAEMKVVGSLPRCLRMNLWVENGKAQKEAKHVYLGGAAVLRPDLAGGKSFAVAIDGPAGCGKSTVAKQVASDLALIYIDTGAMYRAFSLYCMRLGLSTEQEEAVLPALSDFSMEFRNENGQRRVYLAGEDITQTIRTQQVGQGASNVARYLPVREKLVELQRHMAQGKRVIMDGRDIGTHVLPNAQLKIYLDAALEERAKRRLGELRENGQQATLPEVTAQIAARDDNDKNRQYHPLRQADDAIVIDSTDMTVEEVAAAIEQLAKERM